MPVTSSNSTRDFFFLPIFSHSFHDFHEMKKGEHYFIVHFDEFYTALFTEFSSGSYCQIYRVTDEALIAETMVWPNFFLMNVFFALKGSKPFIIIYQVITHAH